MRIVRQVRRVRPLPIDVVVITSVNSDVPPKAGQTGIVIAGRGFGSATGQLHYNGAAITPTSWSPTQIVCTWPDICFDALFSGVNWGVQYTLRVRSALAISGTRLVSTERKTGDIYRQITAVAAPSIFANDTGVVVGNYFNWRTLTGTVTDVNSAGQPRGTSVGATGKYAVWDGSTWTNTANSLVTL